MYYGVTTPVLSVGRYVVSSGNRVIDSIVSEIENVNGQAFRVKFENGTEIIASRHRIFKMTTLRKQMKMEDVKYLKFIELKSKQVGLDMAYATLCGVLVAAVEDGYSVKKLNARLAEMVKEIEELEK